MSLPGPKPRRRAGKRFWTIVIGAVVLTAAVVGAYLYTHNPYGNQGAVNDFVSSFKPLGPTNVLLIGNNARNPATPLSIGSGGGGQADIMMLAHIDPKKKQVTLISIPRDLLFAQPNYNDPVPKIKTMFFIGARENPNQAAQLTVQAVEKFTGMPINYWVVTDFQGFVDAINAVGGVYVDVPGRIKELQHSHANLYPGWQTLNGQQALSLVRVRQNTASAAGSNDFMRDNYQAMILGALKNKLLDKKNDLAHLPALVTTWSKDVVTNMSYATLVKVASAVHGLTMTHINLANVGDSMLVGSAPAPGLNQENYITGAFYDIVDPAQVYQTLKPYGSTGVWTGWTLPDPSTVPVVMDASQVYVDKVKAAGFQVTTQGSGTGSAVIVSYPPGKMTWGLSVGRALATGESHIEVGTDPNAVVVTAP